MTNRNHSAAPLTTRDALTWNVVYLPPKSPIKSSLIDHLPMSTPRLLLFVSQPPAAICIFCRNKEIRAITRCITKLVRVHKTTTTITSKQSKVRWTFHHIPSHVQSPAAWPEEASVWVAVLPRPPSRNKCTLEANNVNYRLATIAAGTVALVQMASSSSGMIRVPQPSNQQTSQPANHLNMHCLYLLPVCMSLSLSGFATTKSRKRPSEIPTPHSLQPVFSCASHWYYQLVKRNSTLRSANDKTFIFDDTQKRHFICRQFVWTVTRRRRRRNRFKSSFRRPMIIRFSHSQSVSSFSWRSTRGQLFYAAVKIGESGDLGNNDDDHNFCLTACNWVECKRGLLSLLKEMTIAHS